MAKLSDTEVQSRLSSLPGWTRDGDAITRTYSFPSFPDAVSFITRLAFQAEAADHHPDLRVSYKKVTVIWSTHSEGGVTGKDVEGAKHSDQVARMFGAGSTQS